MIVRVISGGQTGADQAGLRAAKACGLATGGWVPRGWRTDDGPAPWLAEYGCQEHHSSQYAPRTIANVRMATTLIWFGDATSPGGRLTLSTAKAEHLHTIEIRFPGSLKDPLEWIQQWLYTARNEDPDGTWMIAGNRERTNPGIGAFVEKVLLKALKP
jgi:hypothetical protein